MKRALRLFLGLLVIALLALSWAPARAAENCSTQVCVQVYTDPATGRVIISAHRTAPTPVPRPTRTYVYRPYTPRPVPTRPYVPRPRATHRAAPVINTALSLADQLSQLIPTRAIHVQPAVRALTNVPTYFWSDTDPTFSTAVNILGVPVSVFLKPAFVWNFGDGSPSQSFGDRGGPYPSGDVTHLYRSAGSYTATMSVSWAGTWAANNFSYPVLGGAIVQSASVNLTVVPGPTRYNN
jgi:hypothetical protein